MKMQSFYCGQQWLSEGH